MTGFNLPPGVNVSDIPGNRDEDMWDEAFWESCDAEFQKEHPAMASKVFALFNDMAHTDHLVAYATFVRDKAHAMGVQQGMYEAELEAHLAQEPEDAEWERVSKPLVTRALDRLLGRS